MMSVEHPRKYLCRLTRPDLLKIDEAGQILPHREDTIEAYGKTVPLVHPSEIQVVLNFFYNNFWDSKEYPNFLIMIFYAEKLENLKIGYPVLLKHGEHFADANRNALKSILNCTVVGERNASDHKAEFSYIYQGVVHCLAE